jgi:hypothetical protein
VVLAAARCPTHVTIGVLTFLTALVLAPFAPALTARMLG